MTSAVAQLVRLASRLTIAGALVSFAGCAPGVEMPAQSGSAGSTGGGGGGGGAASGGGRGGSAPATGGAAGTAASAGTGGTGAGIGGSSGAGGNSSGSGAGGASNGGAGTQGGGGRGGVGGAGGRGGGGGASGAGGRAGGQGGSGPDAGAGGAGGGTPDGGGTGGRGGGPAPDFSKARATFSSCRFHFGTIDSKARSAGSALIAQLDYFTPGWMLGASFDHSSVCSEANTGGTLEGKVPVVVAYVAAGNVKRDHSLCDCNVSGCSGGDLCQYGAQYIRQDWTKILNAYRSYSQGYANCYGTTKPIIFEMEPDWYQYTITNQTQPWTAAQAGQYMGELVAALRTNLPNARFSVDASPWVAPNNGSDHGQSWYSNFDMSLFTFVNTSGGGTNAGTAVIRSGNNMTWAGLFQVTGKPILADTGYGANGMSTGHDAAWDSAANINARIADGVTAIAQYNPNGNWSSTIAGIRGQLAVPPYCR